MLLLLRLCSHYISGLISPNSQSMCTDLTIKSIHATNNFSICSVWEALKKNVTIDKILSRVLCAGQPTAGGAVCLLCWLILCGLTLVSFDLSSVILSISAFRGLTLSYFSCLAASANLVLLCCWSNINLFVLCLILLTLLTSLLLI